ncbi:MAG: Yip1 family protein [Phycisphaerales bacterium]
MRCRSCGYALWGITTGRCPECDREFKPSEYRFAPRSVAFTCTGCGASYAGTDERGHLVPSEFTCVQCGTPLAMDRMSLSPAPGVAEGDTMQAPNPWMDRQRRGLVTSFFASIVAILFEPTRFMRSMVERNPADGTVRDAIKFASCVMALAFIPLGMLALLAAALMLGAGAASAMSASAIFLGFLLIFIPIWLLVVPLVTSLVGHLALGLAGATGGGLRRTVQCTLYCNAAMAPAGFLLGLVPLGGFVTLGWQCWSLTLLLREGHRTTTPRALVGSLATVVAPILAAMALAVSLVVFGFSMASARASRAAALTARVAAASASTVRAEGFAGELMSIYDDVGAWPPTPLDAIAAGSASGSGFLAAIRRTPESQWTIGGASAEAIANGAKEQVLGAAKVITWELPKNGLPFRICDTVFTYGMSDGDLDDWMFVQLPDERDPAYVVFTASGSKRIDADRINEELAGLNAARSKRRLAPIPDPLSAPHVVGKSDFPATNVR